MACNEDTTVLSFHDSLLRQSDVALLHGTEWLNDKLIGFYFEYVAVFSQQIVLHGRQRPI